MKIAQIGDIHISDRRIDEFSHLLRQLADSIVEQKPDLVVFTGDLFINRDHLSPKQVEFARKFFKSALKDLRCLVIVGNHDTSMSAKKIDSLSAIFTNDEQIIVYSELGDYVDIGEYRFHMFSYPSKKELTRLGYSDVTQLYDSNIYDLFKFGNKKNVLLYHGILEKFKVSDNNASDESIRAGKELIIKYDFWSKFDIVMAGHLHQYQSMNNAIYSGAPFPLTYADDFDTGYVMWNNDVSSFISLKQYYPFITVDIGDLMEYGETLTEEAVRRAQNSYDYTDARVRIKYTIRSTQSGYMDHARLSSEFRNAQEIKIIPVYSNKVKEENAINKNPFKDSSISDLIYNYIDKNKYSPEVKELANKIEENIVEQYTEEDSRGIHFALNKVKFSNFKCFGDDNKEVDFNKLSSVVGIFGDNRSGKSSFVETIMWGLYGSTLRNKESHSVIRNGQKSATVIIEFRSFNDVYKIKRVRAKSTVSLNFYMKKDDEWIDISGATVVATQKNIQSFVGNLNMFISTIYSPQNNIDILIKKKPSERKQIILDCLQVDVLNKRRKEVYRLRKDYKDKSNVVSGSINAYTGQITDILTEHPNDMIADFERLADSTKREERRLDVHLSKMMYKVNEYEKLKEDNLFINEQLEKLRNKKSECYNLLHKKKNERNKYLSILNDKTKIREGIARQRKYREKIEIYRKKRSDLANLKKALDTISSKLSELKSNNLEKIGILDNQRLSIITNIQGIHNLDCPNPDCPINKKINEELKKQQDKRDEIEDKIRIAEIEYSENENRIKDDANSIRREIEDVNFDGKKYAEYIRKLTTEQNNKWETIQYRLSTGEDIIGGIEETVEAYTNLINEYRDEIGALVTDRTKLAVKINSVKKYREEIEKYKLDMSKVKEQLNLYETKIHEYKNKLQIMSDLQEKVIKDKEKLFYYEKQIEHCNKYNEVVSEKGVLYSFVDRALPIIEQYTKDLLNRVTNSELSIDIDAYKLLSRGGQSDEIKIWLIDSKGKRDVMEASGAETMLISLMLRAALSYLLSIRMGANVELFIIDEGFGALDEENIISIKDLLDYLGEKFNKLLYITHIKDLKDTAQSNIQLTNNGVYSSYEILEGSYE